MRILLINAYLTDYGGTEVVTRDLACEFQRLGHTPIVFAPELGAVADQIRSQGIEVTDDLSTIRDAPEIIHGNFGNTLEALLHFPSTPAVWVCHGRIGFPNQPFFFPRILRYVGVDRRCVQRIAEVPQIPRSRIEMRLNAVDLRRFKQREPLPQKPRRALLFTRESLKHLPVARRACRRMGLQLHVIGPGSIVSDPERVLPQYDIVFAKARCALEALTVGNAVVLCDPVGIGPTISMENFDELREMNFGIGVLTTPLSTRELSARITRYDPENAAVFCARARSECALEQAAQAWLALYSDVISEFRSMPRDYEVELRAAAAYLARRSYETRVRWERRQLQKLTLIPLVGSKVHRLAHRVAKQIERGEGWQKFPER